MLRFDLHRHRIGVTLVCPGGVDTALVGTVDIAGVDPEALHSSGWSKRFQRHAATPEYVAAVILKGVTRNRYLVYTSPDIRALHLLERLAPPVYAVAMRAANYVFVKQLNAVASAAAGRRERESDPAAPAAR